MVDHNQEQEEYKGESCNLVQVEYKEEIYILVPGVRLGSSLVSMAEPQGMDKEFCSVEL